MSSLFQFSNVSFLYEMLRTAFGGVEWFLAAYLLCLAAFFVIGRESLSLGFLYPFLFMLLTIFNPFLIVPFAELIGLTGRIRRLFWLLPVNLVLAFSFTSLCFLHTRKWLRPLIAAACILFIVSLGSPVRPYLQKPRNIYKTSPVILEISEFLAEDSERTGLEKVALYSSQQLLELRQYDPSIRSILRRQDLLDWEWTDSGEESVQAVIDSGHQLHRLALVSRYGVQIDREAFLESARRCHANYLITHTDMALGDYYENAGYTQIGTAGEFEIYRAALEP